MLKIFMNWRDGVLRQSRCRHQCTLRAFRVWVDGARLAKTQRTQAALEIRANLETMRQAEALEMQREIAQLNASQLQAEKRNWELAHCLISDSERSLGLEQLMVGLKKELADSRRNCAELELTNTTLLAKLDRTALEIGANVESIEQGEALAGHLRRQIANLEEGRAQLEQMRQADAAIRADLDSELRAKAFTVEKQTGEIAALRERITALEQSVGDGLAAIVEKEDALAGALLQAEQRHWELANCLMSDSERSADLELANAQLRCKIEELSIANAQLQRKIEELSVALLRADECRALLADGIVSESQRLDAEVAAFKMLFTV